MAPSATYTTPVPTGIDKSTLDEFTPAPFPDEAPVARLNTVSLSKLLANDKEEAKRLFDICVDNGVCYLELSSYEKGAQLIEEAEHMHRIVKPRLDATPIEEKRSFAARPDITGYLDNGYRDTGSDPDGKVSKLEMLNLPASGFFTEDADHFKLPNYLIDFEKDIRTILTDANELHSAILSILEKQLQLPEGTLASIHRLTQRSGDYCRVLNYPAPRTGKPAIDPPQAAHTDATTLGFIFTWQGGLQISNRSNRGQRVLDTEFEDENTWFFVKPVPGHCILQLGDAFRIMTNDLFQAPKHRVVTPPGPQGHFDRVSLLLTARPYESAILKSFSSSVIPDGQYLDKDITAKQWAQEKVLRVLNLNDNGRV